MKRYLKLVLVVVVLFFSCQNNKLKTSEELLKKDLLSAESEKEKFEREWKAQEKILADSLAKLPKGYRFKEDRSVNHVSKPIVIDIAGSLNNIKNIKLSDVASDIEYIRMERVPDTTLQTKMRYKYYLLDDYIVALNYFGIHLFNKQGKFVQTIVKNKFEGVSYNPNKNRLSIRYDHSKTGGGFMVWGYGDKLFYNYSDNITGQKYILEYDCSSASLFENKKFDPENLYKIIGKGEVTVDLNHGKAEHPAKINNNGIMMIQPEGLYHAMGTFLLDRNTYSKVYDHGQDMLAIFNTKGDTLSTFTKLEQLKNYTKNLVIGSDFGTQYENNGRLYFRSPFNDTVFLVIPPNKIVPIYVFNLGKYKVSKQEGVDPSFNFTGKIIPQEFADTKNHLFFTFTKDNYDCPSLNNS